MIRYSRSTNRYGPGGKAGFSSGMAKALASTSSSVMATSCCCLPLVSFAPVLGEVEGGDALQAGRSLQHLRVAQGSDRVRVPRFPVLLHGEAGELVVLGVALVVLRAIDQVHHGEQLVVGQQR